jgi:hypothetical protein
MGATVHWGQRNNLTMKMVEQMYDPNGPVGPLFRWRRTLSRFSRNGGAASFSTDFTRQRGLEVVQPLAKEFKNTFTVVPTWACAGSQVMVRWHARDNPPGTVARLEIRSLDVTAAPPSVFDRPLAGSEPVILPVGRSECTLVVSFTLNGRTLTDSRSIGVRGFQDDDVWIFDLPATCMFIDGIWRWAVTLPFTSHLISDDLRVAEVFCYFTRYTTWFARTDGNLHVPFNWLNTRSSLPSRPILNRAWTFFLGDAGCLGTAPDFHAEFKIVCS